MPSQKTQKLKSSTLNNSQASEVALQFTSKPKSIQAQSISTPQQAEDIAFAEEKTQATELELQAKYGTITPQGQERLTLLQGKMDGLLQTRLENAATYGHDINRIAFKRPDSAPPIQAKLTIGQPGDKYEQEADDTARQVVQRIHQQSNQQVQREAVTEEEELQTKPVDNIQRQELSDDEELQMKPMVEHVADGGMAVSADVEAGIQRARGGGQPLANSIREPMEQAFGADFSGVRVHTDSQADQLNQSIQAKAFTTGQDVFFRQGAYQPGSRGGQELLAHELTHVVQQGGDNVQRRIIQRAVETMGGSWNTNNYQSVLADGNPGAEIELEFTPNKLVDSKKIALLQKIEKTHNGINLDQVYEAKKNKGEEFFSNAEKTAASRTQGNGHWDRALTSTNPVYGAPNLKSGEPLSKTPKSNFNMEPTASQNDKSNYQLGYRYRSFPGLKWNERSAKLYDKPNMPAAKIGSNMIFETTAISLEGTQKNVYYGSVKWGWSINSIADPDQNVATTDIELEPLSVVKMGTPSAEMKELANIWNQAKTYTRDVPEGIPNTSIPMTEHTTTLTVEQLQDPKAIEAQIKTLKAELKLNLSKNDKRNKQFELKFLKDKLQKLNSV